jgi:hypothetical protein
MLVPSEQRERGIFGWATFLQVPLYWRGKIEDARNSQTSARRARNDDARAELP